MILCAALWYLITALLRGRVNVPWISSGLGKNLTADRWKWKICFHVFIRMSFSPSSSCVTNRACWEMFLSAGLPFQTLKFWWLIPGQHKTVWKNGSRVFLVSDEMNVFLWLQRTERKELRSLSVFVRVGFYETGHSKTSLSFSAARLHPVSSNLSLFGLLSAHSEAVRDFLEPWLTDTKPRTIYLRWWEMTHSTVGTPLFW